MTKNKITAVLGPTNTGKTHLAISLAVKALSKEYNVYFTTVSDLLYNLHISKADNSYPRKLKQIVGYDLLVLDELGCHWPGILAQENKIWPVILTHPLAK